MRPVTPFNQNNRKGNAELDREKWYGLTPLQGQHQIQHWQGVFQASV